MGGIAALGGLFLSAFVAATFFPAQSEIVFAALYRTGDHVPLILVTVASVGNVLGSLVNYGLGRFIEHFRARRWFPVSESTLTKAQGWYARYGRWSLLLSWVPVIGDPLTLAAGVMREKIWVFTALVTVAKTGRYVALWLALDLVYA